MVINGQGQVNGGDGQPPGYPSLGQWDGHKDYAAAARGEGPPHLSAGRADGYLSDKHKASIDLVNKGYFVFPCLPLSKKPAIDRWQNRGSRSRDMIDAWWTENPEYNPAFIPGMSGQVAIDLDVKPDKNGVESWVALGGETWGTRIHRTASGGFHLFYQDPDKLLRGSAGQLGEGIDTRGGNAAYVVGPGSTIRYPDGRIGHYEVLDGAPVAAMPEFLTAKAEAVAAARREKRLATFTGPMDTDPDVQEGYGRIGDELAEKGVPMVDHGSDDRIIRLANRLLDLPLTEEKVVEMLSEAWASHFDHDWIVDKVGNAAHYRQNDQGVETKNAAAQAQQHIDGIKIDIEATEDQRLHGPIFLNGAQLDDTRVTAKWKTYGEDMPEPLVTPEIIPRWAEKHIVTYDEGGGGIGKSYIAQQEGMCVAAGMPVLSEPVEQCDVFYLNYENPEHVFEWRFFQIRKFYKECAEGQDRVLDLSRFQVQHLRDEAGAHLIRVTARGEIILTRFGRQFFDMIKRHPSHSYVIFDGLIDAVLFEGATRSEDSIARQVIAMLDRWCVEYDFTGRAILHPSRMGERTETGSYAPAWTTKPRALQSWKKVNLGGGSVTDKVPRSQIATQRTTTKRSNGEDGHSVNMQFDRRRNTWQPVSPTRDRASPLPVAVELATYQDEISTKGNNARLQRGKEGWGTPSRRAKPPVQPHHNEAVPREDRDRNRRCQASAGHARPSRRRPSSRLPDGLRRPAWRIRLEGADRRDVRKRIGS